MLCVLVHPPMWHFSLSFKFCWGCQLFLVMNVIWVFLLWLFILSIPFVFDNGDRYIWHFTQNGRYMVKSGYWTALEYQQLAHSSSGAGSSSSSVEGAPQGPTFYVTACSEYPSNP
ncbi:unnamed protein product [Prunus brigantina]